MKLLYIITAFLKYKRKYRNTDIFALYLLIYIAMHDYCYLNTSKMLELSKIMDGSEIKMLFAILYCINNTDSEWFINNPENRKLIAGLGFIKSPARFSAILCSMVKKGILKREANSVYSILRELYIIS